MAGRGPGAGGDRRMPDGTRAAEAPGRGWGTWDAQWADGGLRGAREDSRGGPGTSADAPASWGAAGGLGGVG
ncbi:hypothetical protein L0P92_38040, partial [Streptomyces muensis]|nr:hypothetical protein [Streptomyces muensis]